jgi:small basic protein
MLSRIHHLFIHVLCLIIINALQATIGCLRSTADATYDSNLERISSYSVPWLGAPRLSLVDFEYHLPCFLWFSLAFNAK